MWAHNAAVEVSTWSHRRVAIYTEANARLQSEALRLGEGRVVFLNEEEAKAAADTDSVQIGRPWEGWKAKALAKGGCAAGR